MTFTTLRFYLLFFILLACGQNAGAAISTTYQKTEKVHVPHLSKKEKRALKKQVRKRIKNEKIKSPNGAWAIIALFGGLLIGGLAQSPALFFTGLAVAIVFATIGLFRDEEKIGAIAAFAFIAVMLALIIGIRIAIRNSES